MQKRERSLLPAGAPPGNPDARGGRRRATIRGKGGRTVPRLLLMEPDGPLAGQLVIRLEHERIGTDVAATGREGLERLAGGTYDLVAASDELPDLGGEGLLIHMREIRSGVPVLLYAATGDVRRRIRCYRLGANDVIPKPLMFEELVVRIWNLLRLAGKADGFPIHVDDLRIDPQTRTAEVGGETVPLTPTEFDLLLYLVRNEGKPLSREQIMENVWGYSSSGQTNLVDVYIRYLRLKIDKKYKKKLFHTVWGYGYRFDAGKEGKRPGNP